MELIELKREGVELELGDGKPELYDHLSDCFYACIENTETHAVFNDFVNGVKLVLKKDETGFITRQIYKQV